jgi:RimJ/RimL family protein N-acetyltransferase
VPADPIVWLFETERLRFRRWTADDFELARALWGDERVTRLFHRGRLDDDQVRARLERELVNEREHGIQYWAMFVKDDGRLAGCCGLRPAASPDPAERLYELGFHLRPECWGAGYATEAGRAVVRRAFEIHGANALVAGHHPDNHASRNVLLKLGFRHTHDELYPPTGVEHPSYRLTREDARR